MKREIRDPKIAIHTFVHFLSVVFLYVVAIWFPLWLAILLIVIHQIHMKYLGCCILTKLAHDHGVMVGFTYWDYIAYLFGAKNHVLVGKRIDFVIKISLGFLFIGRLFLYFMQIFVHNG